MMLNTTALVFLLLLFYWTHSKPIRSIVSTPLKNISSIPDLFFNFHFPKVCDSYVSECLFRHWPLSRFPNGPISIFLNSWIIVYICMYMWMCVFSKQYTPKTTWPFNVHFVNKRKTRISTTYSIMKLARTWRNISVII